MKTYILKELRHIRSEQMLHTDLLIKILSALQAQSPLEEGFFEEFQKLKDLHHQEAASFLEKAYKHLINESWGENESPMLTLLKNEDDDEEV